MRQYCPELRDIEARGADQSRLHEQAAGAAFKHFGRRVFVRGVVEVSNYCRENCHYCGMRRDNKALDRARAVHDEIADVLIHHRPAAITDVNIQTGEDPLGARTVALPLVQTLQRETDLGISVCLGTLDFDIYNELKGAGASVYIMKFETADGTDYDRLDSPGNLDERLEHIRWLADHGWHVSSGFIAGLPGQDETHLLENCRLAASLPLRGCSVSPFVPGESTPLTGNAPGDAETTLNCMAILRLMRPDWVIPAVSALNLAKSGSYRRALQAGANMVTMNLTPRGLREDYLLYKRDRFIMDEERVLSAIAGANLIASRQSLADFYHASTARPPREASVPLPT
jgi:biotin synthase